MRHDACAPIVAVVMCFETTRGGSMKAYLDACEDLCNAARRRRRGDFCGNSWEVTLKSHGFDALLDHPDIGHNLYAVGGSKPKVGHGASVTRGTSQGPAMLLLHMEGFFRDGVMTGDGMTAAVATDLMVAMEAAATIVARPHIGTLPGGSMYGQVQGDPTAGGACVRADMRALLPAAAARVALDF